MPFLGSNTALFPGQAVADLYCSNYWLPAPATPNIPAPGPGGQWPWIRLRNECVGVGWTFFVLEETVFGPGVPNAMWNFMAPGVQAAMLSVLDGGHILFPNAQQVPIAPQFSWVAGQIALVYLLPWGHSATATHDLYPALGNSRWSAIDIIRHQLYA
ncbi:uncharacterized protein STEHIDRAFT_109440 [Stereum hirsutum FP-91666 SS1]|uniref:uncharacterized protein n=1 Tax=Stereum hirsutum (strain FP-91666) TaxID=721885 RepID=UPI000440B4D1|nr:uncharacterized protein STEHIDRAFT_109440 [Stereum hirsutum FP-91666 SS1]EIM89194.1 hypothetical protein STEHIDRAFT_109440 [Stereum hirsutum FP-91666 SS1]